MRSAFSRSGIWLVTLVLGAGLTVSYAYAGSKAQTFTGKVSDSMCGAKHMMAGDDAGCTRACVAKGAKYALVVGDKVYVLDNEDKAAQDELNKLAGEQAKVTGELTGDTISVKSVVAAK
jgi:hypothetical protein